MQTKHFGSELGSTTVPKGDDARQAVDSLRGYVYQALATALAWVDIEENGQIFLEVAEDYAVLVKQALRAVQIKDTKKSGSVTLNSKGVKDTIISFVDLATRNPEVAVELRYYTTSRIGAEKYRADRPAGMSGLQYWREVGAGADPQPIRAYLDCEEFPEPVRDFVRTRDNDELRRDLIRRIHWDCGRPSIRTLRHELEERLIVVGRDLFQIPVQEVPQLVDRLVYKVMEVSTRERPVDRVLTRSELYRLLDAASQITMPRSAWNQHARKTWQLTTELATPTSGGDILTTEQTSWFVDSSTLPPLRGMIGRVEVETQVSGALKEYGTAILIGGTGLGKTVISRNVVGSHAIGYVIVGFQGADADEASARLDIMFARIGGLSRSLLILDDLNHLDNKRISFSLARVVEAVRRRYHSMIITTHRRPDADVLMSAGLDQKCIVDCPYFSEKEAASLVSTHGGDPKMWGKLAHIAGGFGHPQLTHAFVRGMAERDWKIEQIQHVFSQGISSDDIDRARDAARRNLVSVLPEGTRSLLYRLSLAFGRFDRSLALALSEVPPPVSQSGESLDQLVGPWIEEVGKGQFRVSPLIRGSGSQVLTQSEQRLVHECISVQMLGRGTINANDIDSILLHALAGRSTDSLLSIAYLVLSAAHDSLGRLAEHIISFRFIRTDVPIYEFDAFVSGLLRLTQFQLVTAGLERRNVSDVVSALLSDIERMPDTEETRLFEYTALIGILNTAGIANHIDNWIGLLVGFDDMVKSNDMLKDLAEGIAGVNGVDILAGLFSVGIGTLRGVDRLEYIIDQLDEIQPDRRALLLTPVDESESDYATFVNGAWVASRHDDHFDAEDAAKRYQRMAEKTRGWGIRSLSLQCSVAQAVMVDEYQDDKEGALEVLESAAASMGEDRLLSRAKAKIYWRHDEHQRALAIYRSIADEVGAKSPVERAYALREAAIAAAKCRNWLQAKKWFLEAQIAARSVQVADMNVMAIGLGADSAVAAIELGHIGESLARLAESLESLSTVDAESTLRAAHCHRLIRHTVLWAQSRIQESNVYIGGEPIGIEPGICSNPEPLLTIREQPLGHIDIAWYMLAEAEVDSGIDGGIAAGLHERLDGGAIPSSEFSLRRMLMQTKIADFDTVGFVTHFLGYVETSAYFFREIKGLLETFNVVAPERRVIPSLEIAASYESEVEDLASDAILAYGLHAAFANRPDPLKKVEEAFENKFNDTPPGQMIFDYWNGRTNSCSELNKAVIESLRTYSLNGDIAPKEFWLLGLRLFVWINRSNFKDFLTPIFSSWQRTCWNQKLRAERFTLTMPMVTVPPIEKILTIPEDDGVFVAKLLLVVSDAVGSSLGSGDREYLENLAKGRTNSPDDAHAEG